MEALRDTAPAERPRILCVDDEPFILESLQDTLRRKFDVRTAESGAEGLATLEREPGEYAVVISDMRMPVMAGSVFLREARRIAPDATRILLTGHADLDAALDAVNEGQLFRFLTKPCPPDELLSVCAAALEQHRIQSAERVLLEQTLRGAVDALAQVLALGNPAAFGRSARVRDSVLRLCAELEVTEPWQIEVSALLAHLGAVTLPQQTAEKLYAGENLSDAEQAMVARVPDITRRILEHIPRLEGVIEILDTYSTDYQRMGAGRSLPIGARVLRIALDYDQLEARSGDPAVALAALRGRGNVYDQDLVARFAEAVGKDGERRTVIEIPLKQLRAGMMLADDVRSSSTGSLLIARGHAATEQLIGLLLNLPPGAIREPLFVIED